MCAFNAAAANVERRTDPFIHSQCLGAHGGADYIGDGICRAHLMKVNVLNRNVVNLGFGFAKALKHVNRARFGRRADVDLFDNRANLREAAMAMRMLMAVFCGFCLPMAMTKHIFVGMLVRVSVLMRVVVMVLNAGFIVFLIGVPGADLLADEDINFCGTDTAALDAADL